MQKFKLEANFITEDNHLVDGELNVECTTSTAFLASCLFHIIEEIGEKDRKAVELATTSYYKKELGL